MGEGGAAVAVTGFRPRRRRSGVEAGADGWCEGDAPRRSELLRSRDYSGLARVSGPVRGAGHAAPETVSQPTGRLTPCAPKSSSRTSIPTQRAAVTEPVVPLAILAPAGSGKTRALTRRIAWQAAAGNLDPNHVLAVTFTRKAAGELRGRLAPPRGAGRRHRRHLPRGGARPAPAPPRRCRHRDARRSSTARPGCSAPARRRRAAPSSRSRSTRSPPRSSGRRRAGSGPRATPRQVQPAPRETPRARRPRSRRSTPRTSARRSARACWTSTISSPRAPRRSRRIPAFAATQRWRFRHLFVDEFQDVTRAQLDLLRAWLGDGHRPVRRRRSRIRRSTRSPAPTPGCSPSSRDQFEGAAVVRLGANYRSTPEIVHGRAGRAARARARRRCARPGVEGPPPTVTAYPNDAAEARGVADALYAAHGRDAPVVEHGGAVPGQRAVGAVRGGARPGRDPLPRARRGGVPRPARGEDGHRRAAQGREDRARVARSPSTSPISSPTRSDLSEDRREHVDAVAALGREYLAAEGSTGSVNGLPRVPPRVAARRRRRRAARRRGGPPHVPPGQGPRVGHRVRHRPRARARADLARDRASPTRSTRNAACCTSRSAAPSATCTCRGRRSGRAGTRVSQRTKSPYLGEIERGHRRPPRRARPATPTPARAARPAPGSGSRRWSRRARDVGPAALRRARHLAPRAGARRGGARRT